MKVTHKQVVEAYHRWARTEPDFYDFTGAYSEGNYVWIVPDELAHRIHMLCSPHWKTLMKAYFIKHPRK